MNARSAAPESLENSVCSAAPAVLLVGGQGTRLRSVISSVPKPLARIGQDLFLGLILHQLRFQGIRSVVMCTGYLAEQIENEFGDGQDWGIEVKYSRECEPRGTGGAVKLAQRVIGNCSEFLVLNGDSFLEINFELLLQLHRRHRDMVTFALMRIGNAARYGTVQIDDTHRVTGFREKTGIESEGLINAGVYVFSPKIFEHIPDGPVSLERDVFPHILRHGVHAFEHKGLFIDIGTPDDYAKAQQICDRLKTAAEGKGQTDLGRK